MASNQRAVGNYGERLASEYLRKLGYQILGTNIYTPFGELDIVAMDGETLVFVEVKLRKQDKDYLEAIGHTKAKRWMASAEHYIETHFTQAQEMRLDALFVVGKKETLVHMKNFI